MILFIMINNTPDNNHDNSNNEIMRIFFGHQSLKKTLLSARELRELIVQQVIDFFKQL